MTHNSWKLAKACSVSFAAAMMFSSPGFGQNLLTAVKVAQAPKLDTLAADPAWAKAPALKVKLDGGNNFVAGATEATLKAVYTPETLYVLLQYNDPTQSVRRFPYQKQADGSWKKLVDPADKGGDDNI